MTVAAAISLKFYSALAETRILAYLLGMGPMR